MFVRKNRYLFHHYVHECNEDNTISRLTFVSVAMSWFSIYKYYTAAAAAAGQQGTSRGISPPACFVVSAVHLSSYRRAAETKCKTIEYLG